MSNSQNLLGYLSLPAEVRNMVMEYVLMPGDVYPQPSANSAPDIKQLPGFQLLAACKTTQAEGQRLFYEYNTFHIPRGRVRETLAWYNKLLPEHRDMIKWVFITLTLEDLDASQAGLTEIDRWRKAASLRNGAIKHDLTYYLMGHVWKVKLELLANWRSLEVVHVKTHRRIFTIEGSMIPNAADKDLVLNFSDLVPNVLTMHDFKAREEDVVRLRRWLLKRL